MGSRGIELVVGRVGGRGESDLGKRDPCRLSLLLLSGGLRGTLKLGTVTPSSIVLDPGLVGWGDGTRTSFATPRFDLTRGTYKV